ncbi:MAG TPA: DUF5777 family beta-barrel protein [Bacteroidales bacterium]|nr:DUF5777 family beta-barrel protein [Bacteroidales bacterium]
MKPFLLKLVVLMVFALPLRAQNNLLDLFEDESPKTEFAYATFKAPRVVYGQSVEQPAKGNMMFLIQHNFGSVNSGFYDLFGLDRATMRMALEYGLTDRIMIAAGRSTWQKTYDAGLKVKLLRQSAGETVMPVTLSYATGTAINSTRWANPSRENYFSSRLSFYHQLLIARKFSESVSLQLSPTVIHKNLVPTRNDQNTSFALGAGGRFKLTQRASINAEYFYYPEDQTTLNRHDALSLGFDIETGGHVFQLHFSNAGAMFERAFISETEGRWTKGDIYFGFNLYRNFVIR